MMFRIFILILSGILVLSGITRVITEKTAVKRLISLVGAVMLGLIFYYILLH